MDWRLEQHYDATPERTMTALRSQAYHTAAEARRGAISTTVEPREGGGFVVRSVEPAHGIKGVDRSRTDTTETVYAWDDEAQELSWRYRGPHSDRVQMSGTYRAEPEGDGCRLVHDVHIEVRVPLIGNQIAKRVKKELESASESAREVLRSLL